jgi:tetratricopeptide (TPR) repeat protein
MVFDTWQLAGDSLDTSRDSLGRALAILKQLDREGRLPPDENNLIPSLEAAQERISAAELLEVGDRSGALAHYQKSLAIVEKLAAAGPGRLDWQRDLAEKLDKIADVLWAGRDPIGAHAVRTESLAIREKLVVMIEEEKTKSAGKPGARTANALLNAAWQALFTGDFVEALAASERAVSLMPDDLSLETNRAHALLFLNRGDEAKALYLAYARLRATTKPGSRSSLWTSLSSARRD